MPALTLLLLCVFAPAPAAPPTTAPDAAELRSIAWHDAPRLRAPTQQVAASTRAPLSGPAGSELREPFGIDRPRAVPGPALDPAGKLREPFGPRPAPSTTGAQRRPAAAKLDANDTSTLREPFARP